MKKLLSIILSVVLIFSTLMFVGVEVGATKSTQTTTTHKHLVEVQGKKKATYFAKGYSGNKVCSFCGATLSKGKSIKKLKLQKPKKLKVKTKWVKSKKKYMYKASWGKVKDASGYEVKILDRSGKTIKKIKVKSKSKTSATMYSGGYKYRFKVRAYKTKSGKKVYSSWSQW